MRAKTNVPWNVSWGEQKCSNFKKSCPCQYSVQPLLSLRGLCKDSFLWNSIVFTPRQRAEDPYDIVFVGHYSSRIVFNDTSQQWKLAYGVRKVANMLDKKRPWYIMKVYPARTSSKR